MKTAILIFFSIFIFIGCTNKQPEIAIIKKIHSFNNFDYTKEQVNFYEKEFKNILSIDNPNILKEYVKFYNKNSSYFLNGKIKVEKLNKKIYALTTKKKKISEKQGNIKTKRELVEKYKIRNPQKALNILEQLVQEEDIKSMKDYASANIYMIRPVIIQNYEKALKTYERLAELGELSSIMRLGNFYEYGYHKKMVARDKEKALKYYKKAAQKGYLKAKKKLYEIYSCKKCKPDRYDKEKAALLQKELSKVM